MPNDAKLGLVVGVGLVILVAVIFFRKDLGTARPGGDQATAVSSPSPGPPVPTHDLPRGVPVRPTSREKYGRLHTVQEGESLVSLAERYYGDGEKSEVIYRANRDVLKVPGPLIAGTVLVIPDLPEPGEAAADDPEGP